MHDDEDKKNLSRYIGIYFRHEDIVTGEKNYYGAKLCKEVLPSAPEAFWDSIEGENRFSPDDLYCPDTDLFTLQQKQKYLTAYVSRCQVVIHMLNSTSDYIEDCEPPATVMYYVDGKVSLKMTWLSTYFDFERFQEKLSLTWNSFQHFGTIIDFTAKNYYTYELQETKTEYRDSKFFESYDFLADKTGQYLTF